MVEQQPEIQLKNINHNFIDEGDVGVTIRLGTKWADQYISGNRTVDLWECTEPHEGLCPQVVDSKFECEYRGSAKLIGIWVGMLKNTPPNLIVIEHELKARTWAGLRESLKRAYGDACIDTSIVTALIYERLTTE